MSGFPALFILAHIGLVLPVVAMILFARPKDRPSSSTPASVDNSVHIHHHHHYYPAQPQQVEKSDGTVVTIRSLRRIQ
jgi:hypothetical protein